MSLMVPIEALIQKYLQGPQNYNPVCRNGILNAILWRPLAAVGSDAGRACMCSREGARLEAASEFLQVCRVVVLGSEQYFMNR